MARTEPAEAAMRVPNERHLERPWLTDQLLADFRLEDVWTIKPFRYLIVYPVVERRLASTWANRKERR